MISTTPSTLTKAYGGFFGVDDQRDARLASHSEGFAATGAGGEEQVAVLHDEPDGCYVGASVGCDPRELASA